MERIFVDTSAWFALLNGADPAHAAVLSVLEAHPGRLVTTNFVFDEVITLARMRLGHGAAVRFGVQILGQPRVDLIRLGSDDERAAWDLFVARPDQAYSFTDCSSFVVMRRLGLARAVALDADFTREGFTVLP